MKIGNLTWKLDKQCSPLCLLRCRLACTVNCLPKDKEATRIETLPNRVLDIWIGEETLIVVTFVQIQDSQHADFPAVVALYEEAFPPSEKVASSAIAERVDREIYQLFVGYEATQVVFMAMFYPMRESEFVLLAYIATHRDYRGQGIGATFLRESVNRLQREAKYLLIEAEDPSCGEDKALRQRRVNFYRRIGARTMEGVKFVLPALSREPPAEMVLMVAPTYQGGRLPGSLVRQLMTQLYVEGYDRPLAEAQQQSFLQNISDFVELV